MRHAPRGVTWALLAGLAWWIVFAWCAVRAFGAAPPEPRCHPLVIAGQPCGRLCRLPSGALQVRGCRPLNKLVRT